MEKPGTPLGWGRLAGIDGLRRFNPTSRAVSLFRHTTACAVLLGSALASGQEMEPRSYSAVPVGTNFVALDYARSSGGFSVDPSLPITNVHASINTW
jgi:hypothetical protein